MDSYHITGGEKLAGDYRLNGAKNGVLPILAATVLTADICEISSCPHLSDVHTMVDILRSLGCKVTISEDNITADARTADRWEIPDELMRGLRSSVFLLGPLLARFGQASVIMPGGCAIGSRPIDIHLSGLKQLGAQIHEEGERLRCRAPRLVGQDIRMDFPSVGATENLMMAGAAAFGQTRIIHGAREPEIQDLQNFLNSCGARISGAGTGEIVIEGRGGREPLHGCAHRAIPDRIEAGTFLAAAAITGGEIRLLNAAPSQMAQTLARLREAGCQIRVDKSAIWLKGPGRLKAVKEIKTLPYPGFPTDMQSQFLSLLTLAEGNSRITETIFENRFKHTADLRRMGADIQVSGRTALVKGVDRLHGERVFAWDLRGGAALVLAGLAAEGETIIENVFHIDRGYHRFEAALESLGARIKRIEVREPT